MNKTLTAVCARKNHVYRLSVRRNIPEIDMPSNDGS